MYFTDLSFIFRKSPEIETSLLRGLQAKTAHPLVDIKYKWNGMGMEYIYQSQKEGTKCSRNKAIAFLSYMDF